MQNYFNLKETTIKGVESLGFKDFTKVQKEVIPLALKGKSIVAKSQTGTGKTHAFLIPVFEKIDPKVEEVFCVIISPTRELAAQIYQNAVKLNSFRNNEIKIKLLTGGTDRNKELSYLAKNTPQIVVATPGKLHDLAIKTSAIDIHKTKMLIIDEADMALDGGFIAELNKLASHMPKFLQIMTFSATMTQELDIFLKKYMNNPMFVSIDSNQLANLNIEHVLLKTKYRDKYILLGELLSNVNPYLCLIFCNTKIACKKLYEEMKHDGYSVCTINGDQPQRIRTQTMRRIKNLEFTYIVCTDIAARGIDIDDISHVVNYELPKDVEFYVHRSGRTARQNKTGICISFYEFENYEYLDELEDLGLTFEFKQIRDGVMVSAKGRNERKKKVLIDRVRQEAKKNVKVQNRKVKPAYKKKYNYKLTEETTKLRRKKNKHK